MLQLSEELIGQLIYAMEDQHSRFLIHLESGRILPAGELENDAEQADRYVEVPAWRPIDGYNLMERFLVGLRNPLYRGELRSALSSGSGVFRKFKDILRQSPELERLWFAFKGREMRKVIRGWYNDQRELAGLDRLGPEPEETGELILEDFIIRPAEERHLEAARALDRQVFAELLGGAGSDRPAARLDGLYRRARSAAPDLLAPESCLLVAETPQGELAGFAWGVEDEEPLEGLARIRLVQLAVAASMRGLGLGNMLLERFLQAAGRRGAARVRVELEGAALEAGRLFEAQGFTVAARTLDLDLARWERDRTG